MKRTKQVIGTLLALSLSCGSVVGAGQLALAAEEAAAPALIAAAPVKSFADVEAGKWYQEGVSFCVENGLMNGVSDTAFAPDETLSRAMLVTCLWRLAGEPVVNYAMPFTDASEDTWYTEAVRWAASEQIVLGSGKLFGTDDPITREDLATILYRYAKKAGVDIESVIADTNTLSYDDVFTIDEYAAPAMSFCIAGDVIKGSDGYLKPFDKTTRAEAATMLMRFDKLLNGTDDAPVSPVGGWTENTEFGAVTFPETAKAAFDNAVSGLLGVRYTPVAYLGSQVVAGANYRFLCTYETVTAQPETGLAVLTVYADLTGGASLTDVVRFTVPEVLGSELVFPAAGMAGGWTYAEASEAVLDGKTQADFDKAVSALTGVGYTPVALLGTQVVAGTNYAVLCKAVQVTAQPATALAVVTVYADLNGGAAVTGISAFAPYAK